MGYYKRRIEAKIGTHSKTILVLWDDKEITIGGQILAMEAKLYDQLHSSYRRLKLCQYWTEFIVDDVADGMLRVSRI